MKQERVLVLIDGSNFFFKLKDLKLHNLLKLNFVKLGAFLAKSGQIVDSRYYIGRVRQDGSKKSK